eukprot:COSAG01_NODE_158_length_23708_cov_7.921979_5_plen_89_part_00
MAKFWGAEDQFWGAWGATRFWGAQEPAACCGSEKGPPVLFLRLLTQNRRAFFPSCFVPTADPKQEGLFSPPVLLRAAHPAALRQVVSA